MLWERKMNEQIKEEMQSLGMDVFGTSDCTEQVGSRFVGTPFAITIGVRLSDVVIDEIKQGPTKMYFAHYRAVNAMLDAAATRCVVLLQRMGQNALAVPASQTTNTAGIAGDFPHKTAACNAGLGFIGKSGLFISSEFGPRVRLATILTDLKQQSKQAVVSGCEECAACVSACPCGAIVGNEWHEGITRDEMVDAALCSRHMKERYQQIGRGSVCGICVAVCPKAKNAKKKGKKLLI
jgi:epoxyqueuosine reductase